MQSLTLPLSWNPLSRRFVSPLPWGDRLYLASAPWRLPEAKLDAHDKAVISSMPYTAHKVVPNDTGISTLGKVLRQHQSEPKVMAAAIAALGDKANYGKNAVLAHIVPQLKNRCVSRCPRRSGTRNVESSHSHQKIFVLLAGALSCGRLPSRPFPTYLYLGRRGSTASWSLPYTLPRTSRRRTGLGPATPTSSSGKTVGMSVVAISRISADAL
jgi:hypothetical protein